MDLMYDKLTIFMQRVMQHEIKTYHTSPGCFYLLILTLSHLNLPFCIGIYIKSNQTFNRQGYEIFHTIKKTIYINVIEKLVFFLINGLPTGRV